MASKKHTTAAGKPPRKCCSKIEAQRITRVARSAMIQFRDSEPGSKEQELALATLWSFADSYELLLTHTPKSIAYSSSQTLQIRAELVDLGLTNTRQMLALSEVDRYVEDLGTLRNDCRDEIRQRDLGIRLDEARRMQAFLRVVGDAETQNEVLDYGLSA